MAPGAGKVESQEMGPERKAPDPSFHGLSWALLLPLGASLYLLTVAALAAHGDALFADCQPQAILSPPPRLRFTRDGGRYCATLPLPGATKSTLEVLKVEDELVIRSGDRRRSLMLPRRMAALEVESATLRRGELTVSFAATLGG